MHLSFLLFPALALFAAASPDNYADDADLSHLNHFVSRQTPHKKCSTGVHIIAASGSGAQNDGQYSLIGSLANRTKRAIPGSSHVTLPFPKGSYNPYEAEQGSRNMRRYIEEYHAACKDTKMVLLGYSEGAIIGMNLLCGASSPPWTTPAHPFPAHWNKTIVATIVYGDETRAAGQRWNRGSCRGNGLSPRQHNVGCKPFQFGLRSYCNAQDPECCVGGQDPNSHFTYPQEYDKIATKFIVGRFKLSQKKKH